MQIFNFRDGHVTTFRHPSGAYICQMPGHRTDGTDSAVGSDIISAKEGMFYRAISVCLNFEFLLAHKLKKLLDEQARTDLVLVMIRLKLRYELSSWIH